MAIVPYAEIPMAMAEHPRDPAVDERLQAMLEHDIPGFVVAEAGVTASEAVNAMRPAFERAGIQMDETAAVRFETKQLGDTERGLHMDGFPMPTQRGTVNAWHAESGRSKLQLPELVLPTYGDAYAANPDKKNKLPAGTRELFDQGLVDDTVLKPTVHAAEIGPRGLAVWRLSGNEPVPHKITTLEAPRVANAWFGSAEQRPHR